MVNAFDGGNFFEKLAPILESAETFTDTLAANFAGDPALRKQFRQKRLLKEEQKFQRAESRLGRSLDRAKTFADTLAQMTKEQFANNPGLRQSIMKLPDSINRDCKLRGGSPKDCKEMGLSTVREVLARLGMDLPRTLEEERALAEAKRPSLGRVEEVARLQAEAREAAKPPDVPTSSLVDETGNLKTPVTNSLRGQIASFMGGTFSPFTGIIGGLDPAQARRSLEIQVRAEQLLLSGTENSIGAAVLAAAKQLGLDTPPETPPAEPEEPGIIDRILGALGLGDDTPEKKAKPVESLTIAEIEKEMEAMSNIPDDASLSKEERLQLAARFEELRQALRRLRGGVSVTIPAETPTP